MTVVPIVRCDGPSYFFETHTQVRSEAGYFQLKIGARMRPLEQAET